MPPAPHRARGRRVLSAVAVVSLALGVLATVLFSASSSAVPRSPDPRDDPQRVRLSSLRPAPAAAVADLPGSSQEGCHVRPEETEPVMCTFPGRPAGDSGRPPVLVVLGDSIAAQWWSAVRRATQAAGWELHWMTKTACPAAAVTRALSGAKPYGRCDRWRRAALAKVRSLPYADLVVLSGSTRSALLDRSAGTVLAAGSESWADEWRRGYERTVGALGDAVGRVALLRDTPNFSFHPPVCLRESEGETAACSVDPRTVLPAAAWRAEQRLAEADPRVATVDMWDWICGPQRCGPVTGTGVLRYRDNHHLTDTFSAALGPALRDRLAAVLPAPGSTAAGVGSVVDELVLPGVGAVSGRAPRGWPSEDADGRSSRSPRVAERTG